jgi:hypothetical protein
MELYQGPIPSDKIYSNVNHISRPSWYIDWYWFPSELIVFVRSTITQYWRTIMFNGNIGENLWVCQFIWYLTEMIIGYRDINSWSYPGRRWTDSMSRINYLSFNSIWSHPLNKNMGCVASRLENRSLSCCYLNRWYRFVVDRCQSVFDISAMCVVTNIPNPIIWSSNGRSSTSVPRVQGMLRFSQ